MPDRAQKRRQKTTDRLDRITDARTLAAMQRRAKYITKRYPLRVWAIWTSRKFGFWSHVVNGNINRPGGVRLIERDLAEVNRVYDYIRATEKKRTAALEALRDCMAQLAELERRFDALAREIARL
jgi:hypothetical protein